MDGAEPIRTACAAKFKLMINLKAGNALGLAVPQSVRARTDEVSE